MYKEAIDLPTVWERRRKGIKGKKEKKRNKGGKENRKICFLIYLLPCSMGIHEKILTEDLLQPLLKEKILSSRDSTWGTVSTREKT